MNAFLFRCRLLFAQPALTRGERQALVLAAVLTAMLLAWPQVASGYGLTRMRDALILALFALSLDFLWGRAHLLILGHGLSFGIGAYALAIATTLLGWGILAGILLGIAVAGLVAAALGYFLLYGGVRLHFFAIMSMAALMIAAQIATSWSSVTGGDVGILGIPGWGSPAVTYYGALAVLLAALAGVWALVRGPYGLVLAAIGMNEGRAKALGHDSARHLVLAYAGGAALAGLAGGMFATTSGVIAPDVFAPILSTEVLVLVAIGGRGSLIGPVIAAVLIHHVSLTVSSYSTSLWPLMLGGLFLVLVFALPDGIGGLLRRIGRRQPRPAAPEVAP